MVICEYELPSRHAVCEAARICTVGELACKFRFCVYCFTSQTFFHDAYTPDPWHCRRDSCRIVCESARLPLCDYMVFLTFQRSGSPRALSTHGVRQKDGHSACDLRVYHLKPSKPKVRRPLVYVASSSSPPRHVRCIKCIRGRVLQKLAKGTIEARLFLAL